MTTFQDNFLILDTDPQFQFMPTNSPSTNSSNLSEDACSVNQSFLDNFDVNFNYNNSDKCNLKANYESNYDSNGDLVCKSIFRNGQNYESSDADIEQLVEFVDKIECEFEIERKLKLANLNDQNKPDLFSISKSSEANEPNENFCSVQQDLSSVINNFEIKNIDKLEDVPLHNQPADIKLEKSNEQVSNLQQNEHSDSRIIRLEKHIPRPPNSFMIFGKQNRKLLANQFPDYTNKQISKILGDEWRKMDLQQKQHFHRLADEAHKKHMEKYPNYYYSPLEARQRKADRKKKFIQKFNNSKRAYKQNLNDNSDQIKPNELDVMNVVQIANLNDSNPQVSSASSLQVNAGIKLERQIKKNDFNVLTDQIKIVDQKVLDTRLNQMNNSPIHNCNYYSESSTQLALNLNQINQMNNLSNNENDQNTVGNMSNNYDYTKPNLKYTLNHFGNLVDRNLNNRPNCQLQPNVLYYSSDNLSNSNIAHQLLNNQQQQPANPNCRSQNNQQYFFNENQMDNNFVYNHHRHSANNFSTPTIYHVTNKDPNLNSTLNDNYFMSNMNGYVGVNNNYGNSLNFNQNLNVNQLFSLNHHQKNSNNTLSYTSTSQSENVAYNSSVGQIFSLNEILVDTENPTLYSPQQQVPINKNNQLNDKLLVKWD